MMGIKGFHGVAAFVGAFFSRYLHTLFHGGGIPHTHIRFEEHTGFLFVYPVVGRQGLHNLYSDLVRYISILFFLVFRIFQTNFI